MEQTINRTDFKLPGQVNLYHGKVRDVYNIDNRFLVMVASDRISAFDHILPRAIPFKGQVLNGIANHFMEITRDLVPNWILANSRGNEIAWNQLRTLVNELIESVLSIRSRLAPDNGTS